MGSLTERGKAVEAGGSALAGPDGDDTLTVPTGRPDDNGAADTDVEAETSAPDGDVPPSGPADLPAPPAMETADDVDAATRETRPAE